MIFKRIIHLHEILLGTVDAYNEKKKCLLEHLNALKTIDQYQT